MKMFTAVGIFLLALASTALSQQLELVTLDAKLPSERHYVSAVYDGDDNIYILGGIDNLGSRDDILKFSISQGTLSPFGQMRVPVYGGSAIWLPSESSIVYFGGELEDRIWKFAIRGNTFDTTLEGRLPAETGFPTAVLADNNLAYLFGGNSGHSDADVGGTGNKVVSYAIGTNVSERAGTLKSFIHQLSSVWDESERAVYLFGGFHNTGWRNNEIWKYNAQTAAVTTLTTMPEAAAAACAIWTGTEAYVTGGSSVSGGFYRFEPRNQNLVTLLPVPGFENTFGHGCAYIEKLNRVYLFGGVQGGKRVDRIAYVDL